MKKRRNQSRLEKSFLDINNLCILRAKRKFRIKESSLVKMAEKAVAQFGIKEDDPNATDKIEEYFRRLRQAFGKQTKYYLNSDYVFLFKDGVLLEIIPIHESVRSDVQNVFKQNKIYWDALDDDDQKSSFASLKDEFLYDAGLQKMSKTIDEYDDDDDYWRMLG